MHRIVYKVCTTAEWRAACARGVYAGSADDHRDGFLHLSTAEQLAGTLSRHFAGRSDLVLVAFDAESLGEPLKWEPSRGGQLFPHLYASLAPALALSVETLPVAADGQHTLPDKLSQDPQPC